MIMIDVDISVLDEYRARALKERFEHGLSTVTTLTLPAPSANPTNAPGWRPCLKKWRLPMSWRFGCRSPELANITDAEIEAYMAGKCAHPDQRWGRISGDVEGAVCWCTVCGAVIAEYDTNGVRK